MHHSFVSGGADEKGKTKRLISSNELRLFLAVCWRQGLVRSTRLPSWWQLLAIELSQPHLFYDYLTTLGVGEHFFNAIR